MKYSFRKIKTDDQNSILSILQYYTEHSFAAYPDNINQSEHFNKLFELAKSYPFYVVVFGDQIVGFGLLQPYSQLTTFQDTCEITYFIDPQHTQKGLGRNLLELLEKDARKMGIKSILANISSLNSASLNFHLKYGFEECGRFKQIGKKFNQQFDVVWMQKFLTLIPV